MPAEWMNADSLRNLFQEEFNRLARGDDVPLQPNEFRCIRCLRRYTHTDITPTRLICAGCNEDNDAVCAECCSCWECNGHGSGVSVRHTIETERCEVCNQCMDTCRCVRCADNGCQTRRLPEDICTECRRCASRRDTYGGRSGCCRCAEPWTFWSPPGGVMFHHGKLKKNRSSRFVAAEIEFNHIGSLPRAENLRLMNVCKKWGISVVRDGSVRACELNTAPANGDAFIDQMDEIGASLTAHRYEVDHNCGVHVHVDCRDLNFYDIRKLMYLYRFVEPALFSIVHPKRKNSSYCRPCSRKYVEGLDTCTQPKEAKQAFFRNIYGANPGREVNRKKLQAQGKGHGVRYSALNMHSWVYRGTIENRTHHGTGKTDVIKNWALTNAALIDFMTAKSEREIRSMYSGDLSEETPIEKSLAILKEAAAFKNVALADWVGQRYDIFKARNSMDLPSDT